VKPAPFDYHAPTTVGDAVTLLHDVAASGADAKIIAGGQSLVPMLNLRLTRFDTLVDIGRIDPLRSIARDNGTVTIGAGVRQCDVEVDATVAAHVPLLARATPLIGHFQIRSRGTLGGSIAHADPASEYPAVALALDAELDAEGPAGSRTIAARDFFAGTWTTALEADEILVAARFPTWPGRSGFAVEEVARRHGDFAIAGAVAGVTVDGGAISRATIALFGMGSTPLRAPAAEAALVGAPADEVEPDAIGSVAIEGLDPPEDLHASAGLRRRIGRAVVARAIGRALEEVRA
jgi:carbon-monoxide dehydrogenase medium subunit